mmetsp:Transcript_69599/g.197427  ORF Transcript_69599/g.197427 Transcript_69599/m.197427 type:complete len:221 (+) Transcript_69599:184-846(+)
MHTCRCCTILQWGAVAQVMIKGPAPRRGRAPPRPLAAQASSSPSGPRGAGRGRRRSAGRRAGSKLSPMQALRCRRQRPSPTARCQAGMTSRPWSRTSTRGGRRWASSDQRLRTRSLLDRADTNPTCSRCRRRTSQGACTWATPCSRACRMCWRDFIECMGIALFGFQAWTMQASPRRCSSSGSWRRRGAPGRRSAETLSWTVSGPGRPRRAVPSSSSSGG